jgi:predicted ATPase with chaperone activity
VRTGTPRCAPAVAGGGRPGLHRTLCRISLDLDTVLFDGKLVLDGSVCQVDALLPMSYVAKEHGFKAIFVSQADVPEVALMEGYDASQDRSR